MIVINERSSDSTWLFSDSFYMLTQDFSNHQNMVNLQLKTAALCTWGTREPNQIYYLYKPLLQFLQGKQKHIYIYIKLEHKWQQNMLLCCIGTIL